MQTNFEYPVINWDHTDLHQEFARFRRHVEFVFDGPLGDLTDKKKAGWLGTWLGAQGREIYLTLAWDNAADKENPKLVLDQFEKYVQPRKNKRMARHRLKQRHQTAAETFDNFVKDLRLIIMDCEFNDPEDILIDCIIDGVHEPKLQEKLLDRGDKLTLAKAIEVGQQFELSKKQMQQMQSKEDTRVTPAFAVKHKKNPATSHSQGKKYPPKATKPTPHPSPRPPPSHHKSRKSDQQHNSCGRCGKEKTHSWNNGRCPAINSICQYCKKEGHWLVCCERRLKKYNLHALEGQDVPDEVDEVMNIYSLQADQNSTDKWCEPLIVNNTETVNFRIDTGAKCNTLVLSDYQKLQHEGELQRSRKIISCYFNVTKTPLASVTLPVSRQDPEKGQMDVQFEIVDLQQENILSGDVAEALGLVARIYKTEEQEQPAPGLEGFPDICSTSGTLPGVYTIKLEPGAKGVIHPPRRQPAALKQRIIDKLLEMERDGVIERVEEPTEWVSSMVVTVRDDKIRICIDPSDLNKVIKREHHPMRTIEDVIAEIPDAKVFSVLDAKAGFLQIQLDEESSYLTCMNTPLGRVRWKRLPFGLVCRPEIFQRIMDQMLESIPGAFAIADDVLIAGRDVPHHDVILREALQKATEYNLRLNMKKCLIRQPSVPYVGHLVTSEGLKPDPQKVAAVQEMPVPQNKEDVKRFIGFVTYLSKFIPNLSEIDAPLRQMTKSDVEFQWQPSQQTAFDKLKELCSHAPVLRYYDPSKPVEIHCDASQHGLGAVLMQEGQPVAYSSRSLTDTETRYAQIEKEMLSIVHACKKFHCFIFGQRVTVYNDHKPLEVIFTKPLLSAPMRLQRMLLSLQWYDLKVVYRKGTEMTLPDTLSRAQLPGCEQEIDNLEYINMLHHVSCTKEKYLEIQQTTQTELQTLYNVILDGWPDTRREVPIAAQPYWDSRAHLAISDGIIYKGMRIVIPPSMRAHMLHLVHESHLGMVKCKQRAREALYWPGINGDIEEVVRNCSKCAEYHQKQPSEPLSSTPVPDLPYQEVGTDIFDFEGKQYIITVDYYSQFIAVDELPNEKACTVISMLKSQFATHGIPQILRSDCGTQFMSREFQQFCQQWNITHLPSSPYFQSSNGEAERAVKTVKSLWRKGNDKYLALLDHRTTPLPGINLSPAQLLMSRRPRNTQH